jgi:hypothetical protein
MGWRPDGKGPRVLVEDISDYACRIGMSESHVAGYLSKGCGGYGYDHRIFVAEIREDGQPAEPRVSPPLTDVIDQRHRDDRAGGLR